MGGNGKIRVSVDQKTQQVNNDISRRFYLNYYWDTKKNKETLQTFSPRTLSSFFHLS